MARHLSDEEVIKILKDAQCDYWNDPFYYQIGFNPGDVTKVSLTTGLIFICGNKYFGNTHIANRHNGYSYNFNREKLPTQFDVDIAPMVYHSYADDIYLNGTIMEKTQYKTVYEAALSYKDSKFSKYQLVLFKDTKIVLTMYPLAEMEVSPRYYKSNFIDYVQDVMNCRHILIYHFYDNKGISKFLLKVTLDKVNNTDLRQIFILNKRMEISKAVYGKLYILNIQLDNLLLCADHLSFPSEEHYINNYSFT